jgi:Ser/Thr protein kinase RdoA (MazF antagonist)
MDMRYAPEIARVAGDLRAEAAARAALSHYGFPDTTEVALLSLSENAPFRAVAPDGRTGVLRVHRAGYHTHQRIASEVAWTRALRADAGLATPVTMPTRSGAHIVVARSAPLPDERFCVMFEEAAGAPPDDRLAGAWANRLGATAATLHRHGASWTPPVWFHRFSWDLETTVGAVPRWGRWQAAPGIGPAEHRLLAAAQERIRLRLERFGRGPDRYGLVHADLRLGNLLAVGDTFTVIDFDDCGYGWFLWDLATALTFIEDRSDVPAFAAAWTSGYRSVGQLSAEAEAEIPTFLLLRRLQVLAWIALHPETGLAREAGAEYTRSTCRDAERYLAP